MGEREREREDRVARWGERGDKGYKASRGRGERVSGKVGSAGSGRAEGGREDGVKSAKTFLVIENKSYNVMVEGRRMDGIRISEIGKGFQASIFLEEEGSSG